ncbi:MAG: PorT family protein [Bergeyella sp.]|nr:PorT family protein [Bergeyella sp.]
MKLFRRGLCRIINTTVKNMRYSFGYINVSVMLKYYAVPDKFYIEAGPELGFLLSSEFKVDVYSVRTGNATGNKNTKEFFTDFNFGLGLGLGYRFTPNFGANLRYILGLTSIYKRLQCRGC